MKNKSYFSFLSFFSCLGNSIFNSGCVEPLSGQGGKSTGNSQTPWETCSWRLTCTTPRARHRTSGRRCVGMNGTQHPSNDQVRLIVVSMSRYGLPSCDHASMIVLPSWQLFLLFLGQGSGNISINEVGWRKIGRLRRVKRGLDRRLNVGLWVVDLLVEEVLEFGQVVEGAPRIIEVHETWRNLKWYLRDVKNRVVVKLLNRMWSLLNGSIKINRLKHPSNHLK